MIHDFELEIANLQEEAKIEDADEEGSEYDGVTRIGKTKIEIQKRLVELAARISTINLQMVVEEKLFKEAHENLLQETGRNNQLKATQTEQEDELHKLVSRIASIPLLAETEVQDSKEC